MPQLSEYRAEIERTLERLGMTEAQVAAGARETMFDGRPSDHWRPPPGGKTREYRLEKGDVVMVTKYVQAPDRLAVVVGINDYEKSTRMYKVRHFDADGGEHYIRRDGLTFVCAAEDIDEVDWERLALVVKTRDESLTYYAARRRAKQERIDLCLALEPAIRLTSTG